MVQHRLQKEPLMKSDPLNHLAEREISPQSMAVSQREPDIARYKRKDHRFQSIGHGLVLVWVNI